MSQTFALCCHEMKSYCWIGQGWGEMTSFYSGAPGTMGALKQYLNDHRGQQLEFVCLDEHEKVLDYTEYAAPASEQKHAAEELLRRIASTDIPESISDAFTDVEFDLGDGWTVAVFYDCGELDYISWWRTADGERFDFWDWPESDLKSRLMNWRGNDRQVHPDTRVNEKEIEE